MPNPSCVSQFRKKPEATDWDLDHVSVLPGQRKTTVAPESAAVTAKPVRRLYAENLAASCAASGAEVRVTSFREAIRGGSFP